MRVSTIASEKEFLNSAIDFSKQFSVHFLSYLKTNCRLTEGEGSSVKLSSVFCLLRLRFLLTLPSRDVTLSVRDVTLSVRDVTLFGVRGEMTEFSHERGDMGTEFSSLRDLASLWSGVGLRGEWFRFEALLTLVKLQGYYRNTCNLWAKRLLRYSDGILLCVVLGR